MKPDHQHQQERAIAAYMPATSPWTELYQNAAASSQQVESAAAFDSDDQRPTHDALSDIYNRVYQ